MNYEDKKRLIEFIEQYDSIHEQMDLMQVAINNLVKKRETLLEKVDSLKIKEKKFLEELIEKYGPEAVTPNKLMEIARCSS